MVGPFAENHPMASEQSPTPKVLVVDDEQLIRWSLRETLTQQGYEVVEAGDGRAALRFFQPGADPIDVVLLDLRLPDTDGIKVLQHIKATDRQCQVILVTAFGSPETTEQALQKGAFLVTNKPFKVEDILHFVAAALNTRRVH